MAACRSLLELTVTVVVISIVSGQCRNGWIKYEDSCYLFTNVYADWHESEFECVTMLGGYLVEIESAEEDNFLRNQAETQHANDPTKQSTGYWIGASDVEVEGDWIWMKSRHQLKFADWYPGQPTNHGGHEDCVHMRANYDFHWDDGACSNKAYYICEMPITQISGATQTSGAPIIIG